MRKFSIGFIFLLFSVQSYAGIVGVYHGSAAAQAACQANHGYNYCGLSGHAVYDGTSTGYSNGEAFSYAWYNAGCPVDTTADPVTNECVSPPEPVAEAGDTMVAECHSWQDDCINQDYVDESGTIWTNDGLAICDGDTCINQWTNSGVVVDLNAPETWPENTAPSTDDSTPTGLGPSDESSPFDNYDPGADVEITTESDLSTETNSDGSGTTTQTDTRLLNDGTKQETTTTVETDSSGGTTTTTSTKTTTQDGSTSTQSATETKDAGGTVLSTSSITSTDEDGEQEEDPSKAFGGGTCDSPPVCEGDPVQCKIVEIQWKEACGKYGDVQNSLDCSQSFICNGDPINCAIAEIERAKVCETLDGLAADSAFDTLASTQGLKGYDDISAEQAANGYEAHKEVDLSGSFSDLDSVPTTSGTCPSDIEVNLGSMGSVNIPLSAFCTLLTWIGYLVRLGAAVISFNMIFATIKGL